MLNSLLQTLAEILATGTALASTEQIDFSHPSMFLREAGRGSSLNLHLYDVRASRQMPSMGRQVERHYEGGRPVARIQRGASWFDVSILLTVRDQTVLGEHRLFSEALSLLMRHPSLREEFLASDLQGYGDLPISLSRDPPIDIGSLWSSLSAPIRPAIYLTVTVPFNPWKKTTVPLVVERHLGESSRFPGSMGEELAARQVAIAGLVKNELTRRPIKKVKVMLEGTEKAVTTDLEGLFFFENLRAGSYILQLKRFGYQTQNCNVLVDQKIDTPKEIFLMPS
ncbi:MAG: Pvc16 family protein [Thermosynechococcaceae cyanobacterium]